MVCQADTQGNRRVQIPETQGQHSQRVGRSGKRNRRLLVVYLQHSEIRLGRSAGAESRARRRRAGLVRFPPWKFICRAYFSVVCSNVRRSPISPGLYDVERKKIPRRTCRLNFRVGCPVPVRRRPRRKHPG